MVDGIEVDPAPVSFDSENADEGEDLSAQSDTDPQTSNPGSESDSEEESEAVPVPALLKPKSQKNGPAWVDPDDLDVQVSLASDKRLRKLRDTAAEDEIGGRDYERRLRRQFE